jgi:multidrug resistance efflux pump
LSTEQIESQPAAPASPVEAPAQVAGDRAKARNPLRRWVGIIVGLIVLVFAYSLIADRLTPYTPQGVVQAFVVGIAPEVPGRVSEVNAVDNQKTAAGAVLFRVDPEPYQIAVEKAEADVAAAGQSIGANTAGVTAAQAKVAEAHANLENAMEQTARTLELVKKGVFAKAKGDEAKAQRDAAKAQARQAEAELRRAQESLGPQGADNPQLRAATAVLAKAQRDLVHTAVLAPTDGLVTNLQLTLGQFVPAGQPIMTFIDGRSYWIVASLRENSLEHVRPDAPVEIVFDVLPGQVFSGRVESIGWGVSNYNSGSQGGLPTIKNQTGWIRDPQRFPVRIELDVEDYVPGLRHGSQANVIIYTGDNSIANWLGKLWIRLVSVLTYAT